MADKVAVANKKDLPATKAKKPAGTGKKNVFLRLGAFLKDTHNELKLVTWPTRKDLVTYTVVVLVFCLIVMAITGLFDIGLTELLNLVTK